MTSRRRMSSCLDTRGEVRHGSSKMRRARAGSSESRPKARKRRRREVTPRRLTVTAIFERHGKWYVGYVPEIPGVNAQERSLPSARASLKAALRELALISPKQVHGVRRQVERLRVSLVA